jgi:hypothetical protein
MSDFTGKVLALLLYFFQISIFFYSHVLEIDFLVFLSDFRKSFDKVKKSKDDTPTEKLNIIIFKIFKKLI